MYKKFYYSFLSDTALIAKIQSGEESKEYLWQEFVNRYSKLILKIIWQYDNDHDEVMDKYLWICTKLSVNDFLILKKFKIGTPEKTPKFTTWLVAVVRNLCVDAHRAKHGRRRLPKALLKLPELDRKIFDLYYWKGLTIGEIDLQLNSTVNRTNIPEALERIENSLGVSSDSIKQNIKSNEFVRIDEINLDMLPGVDAEKNFNHVQFERWIENLQTVEKLVVRLKFWEDLSAKEIAEQLELESEQRVYTILKSSIKKLRSIAVKEFIE